MLKVTVLVLTVLFALQRNVKGNPLSSDPPSVNIETRRDTRMFQSESKHWPNFHHSWVPSFPTFSVSNVFTDEDDLALAVLKKKVLALENSQKELFQAVEQLDKAIKAPPCDTVSAPVVTDEEPSVITEESDEPLIIEEVNTSEDTKKNQVQSVTEATNGANGVVVASATNPDKETPPPTKVDEKNSEEGTVAPIENNDAPADVVANENVANETVPGDDGEKAGSTVKLEELEATLELAKPQPDVALERNEKIASSTIDVAENDRALHAEEDERRWNTPPELIPEQVIRKSNAKNERSLSIPITTNINVNTGNNAHSLGFQVSPEGIGYSESTSFNHPVISQSQSVSLAVGSTGVSGAVGQAVGQHHPVYGSQGNVNAHSFGFGSAAASASGTVQNGHASSAAASSVGSGHSSASSSGETIVLPEGMHIRFPGGPQRQPIWTNIHPNYNNNDHGASHPPKLNINVKPYREQNSGPITLQVSSQPTRWENRKPTIRIHKWHPTYRPYYDEIQL